MEGAGKRMLAVLAVLLLTGVHAASAETKLLNASYDPTREFYDEYNKAFAVHWKATKGEDVSIAQSHGGSGKQARAVIDGLEADVVTLALASDVNQLVTFGGLIEKNWQARLPHNSAPYTSTIVFLVRKGNPKGLKDWPDLAKSGVEVITPNPKTSGGARWNYLAAWGDALKRSDGSEEAAKEYLKKLFANVPVLDTGARGSMTTFAERGLGDALIAWENEALLAIEKDSRKEFDVVYPPLTILAEPTVSVVDKVVTKKGTRAVAEEYLKYLYSDAGQNLAAKYHYRPSNVEVLKKYRTHFPEVELLTVDTLAGGWDAAQKKHFSDGGIFDQISTLH